MQKIYYFGLVCWVTYLPTLSLCLPPHNLPCWLQQPNNELYAFCCAKRKLVYIFLLYEICLHFVPCALILFVLVQKMQAVLTCRELLTAVKMEHIRLLLPYCITDAPRSSFCGGVAECGCNNSEQFIEISGLLATAALKYCNLLVWQRTVRIAQWPP